MTTQTINFLTKKEAQAKVDAIVADGGKAAIFYDRDMEARGGRPSNYNGRMHWGVTVYEVAR